MARRFGNLSYDPSRGSPNPRLTFCYKSGFIEGSLAETGWVRRSRQHWVNYTEAAI